MSDRDEGRSSGAGWKRVVRAGVGGSSGGPAGGVTWALLVIAGLSLLNAVRQYYLGSGLVSRRLAGLWFLLALLAGVAGWAAWRRARWAWLVAGLWAVGLVVTTVLGTALLYGGRPPVSSVLPGTVAAVLIGWVVVRGVRRRTVS